jgi:hypothetical protein
MAWPNVWRAAGTAGNALIDEPVYTNACVFPSAESETPVTSPASLMP